MKNSIQFHLAAFCLMTVTACVAEGPSHPSDEGMVEMSFNFGNTRTVMSEDADVLWQSGDCISVFDLHGNNRFTTTDSGASAIFNGKAYKAQRYFILYPYDAEASYSDGFIRTTLPSEQKAVGGSFGPDANISTSKLSETANTGQMKNAAAYIKFTISATGSKIRSITLTSRNGTALSGKVKIDISGEVPTMTAQSSGTSASISIESEAGISGGKYYICTIPAEHSSGFTMELGLGNGSVRTIAFDGKYSLTRNSVTDLGTVSTVEEEEEDKTPDPASAYASNGVVFNKLTSSGHPRLFADTQDFAALKASFDAEEEAVFSKIHSQVLAQADIYSASSELPSHTLTGGILLEESRLALSQIFYCAYAYRMTGADKYLQKARAVLNTVCAFNDWNVEGQFLDAAEMGLAVAIGYDWLYYDLSLAERKAAHKAMKDYLLAPFLTYETTIKSNWNQVCNGGSLAAAIVLYELDKTISASAIDKAISSNLAGADYLYNPNGNGIEGYGYWDYATAFQESIISALEKSFGTSCGLTEMNGIRKTGEWLLYLDGPTGPFNFSDVASESSSAKPMMLWLAARYGRPELMVREKLHLQKSATYSTHRILPLVLTEYARHPITSQSDAFPTDRIWYASGDVSPLILVRIGWKYGSTDEFLGIKGCGASNNHSHMDAGNFVYDSRGVRWASDLYFANYTEYRELISNLFSLKQKSERWDILPLNNYFHNTLSFTWCNGTVSKLHTTDQVAVANKNVKEIINSSAEGYGGTIDLSAYYSDAASKVERTAVIKDSELHVTDRITALNTHSADFEWRMLTKTTPTVDPEGKYIKLTSSDGKVAYLYTIVSGNVASAPVYGSETGIARPSGWTAREWDNFSNYKKYNVVKFSSSVTKGKQATYTTVISSNKPY